MSAKRFYFILLALLVLSAGGIVGAFVWGKDQLKENANVVSELIAERDAQRENIIILQQAETQTNKIESVDNLLNNLLPNEKNQETLILDIIYTATSESSIPLASITSFSFSGSDDPNALSGTNPVKEISGVLEYPFSIELQEISYQSLLKLLYEVENNGRIIQVDTVQITPSKVDPGVLSSVNLTMKAYVKP